MSPNDSRPRGNPREQHSRGQREERRDQRDRSATSAPAPKRTRVTSPRSAEPTIESFSRRVRICGVTALITGRESAPTNTRGRSRTGGATRSVSSVSISTTLAW